MKAPTNTTNQDPLFNLLETAPMFGGSVESQEARGQRQFVESDVLPTHLQGNARDVLEKAGVKFAGPVEGDDQFQYVELPAGWTKKPTDHSMWSELLDEKGRKRASIFYKAAFYDRSAHLNVESRYNCHVVYPENEAMDDPKRAVVTDCGAVIFTSNPYPVMDNKPWEASDAACAEANAWMIARFPNAEVASAYWDD